MKNFLTTTLLSLLLAFATMAQEGMWLMTQINDLNLKEKGLKIETSDIYNTGKPALYNAVIQLGGGTASFVSPEGLIITNHHVAFEAIQRASSAETDYITNGFLARERRDEIQAQGYEARLLLEMTDVTNEVLKAAKGITDPSERDRKIKEKITRLTDGFEKNKADTDARVAEMYNGKQYFLFVYKVFKDIRLVYAPPVSIGNYGDEIDNWMWPRHTGDFSFLRVYVSPEGEGAEYSTDNVPYTPKIWLKVADGDLDNNDFTFIIGYPGMTTRYRTSNSAAWNLKHNYPFTIDNFEAIIDLMDELTEEDADGKIKVAGMRAGLANTMKNYQGKVDGMVRTQFVEDKIEFEKEFMDWVNSSPETKAKYGTILSDIKKEYDVIETTKERDNILGILQGLSGTRLAIAGQAYLLAKELEKPKKERQPGINEETANEIIGYLPYQYNNYFEPVDKALLVRTLEMLNALPDEQRIEAFDYIFDGGQSIEEFVNEAYTNSSLDDVDYAKSLFTKTPAELEALDDPLINMAAKVYPVIDSYQEMYNMFAANVTDLRKQYIDALYAWKGATFYPDANSTMRFTSGPVKGYIPEDAVWYNPFTSLKGVIAKDTGKEPFDAPEKLKALYDAKDYGRWVDPDLNDVPVAFLHQCDITGGNSGSPVMNAKGELIGVAFDGNYEAMISDWQYDADLQRTISVDIRYVLFITEKFSDAGFLLEEMGVN